MRFASGISDAVNVRQATETACQQVVEALRGAACHVAFLFVSPIYRTSWPALLGYLRDQLRPTVLIGCSGSGLIGGSQELEWVPGVSLVAAHLPDVRFYPFAVAPEELELSSPGGFWVDKIGASPDANPVFVVFADPYTTQPMKLIEELNATYRARPIVGGLVSGGNEPGEHLLFLETDVYREGVVGLAMTGNITMDTIVSQGCRPIGRPLIITRADENVILQLKGKPALEVLHEVLAGLTPDDRALAQRGSIFVGLAINEMRPAFGSGDFLVRNIMGVDPEAGAIAVAEQVEVGQTLQFQLRDPTTSRQELRRLLHRQLEESSQPIPPAGGLLCNCSGRGKALYGSANQDVRTIQMVSGKLPVGGFFCNGEIGPIGGINFLHGYTASLGLFRPVHVPLPKSAIPTQLKQPG
jgi:small ligand-binding sensory domain FIST